MTTYDVHIKNGTIIDGTRVPRFRGDLWIKDGKIAQIGGRAAGFAKKTIEAGGLIVAPGFVDLHTRVYEDVLAGQGFGIGDARPSIELVHRIRHAPVTPPQATPHPMLATR